MFIKAADEFKDKTTASNQMWQTDFTYLKVIGWGWFYLSTILDDYLRYVIGWKLCGNLIEPMLGPASAGVVGLYHALSHVTDNVISEDTSAQALLGIQPRSVQQWLAEVLA